MCAATRQPASSAECTALLLTDVTCLPVLCRHEYTWERFQIARFCPAELAQSLSNCSANVCPQARVQLGALPDRALLARLCVRRGPAARAEPQWRVPGERDCWGREEGKLESCCCTSQCPWATARCAVSTGYTRMYQMPCFTGHAACGHAHGAAPRLHLGGVQPAGHEQPGAVPAGGGAVHQQHVW